MMSYRDLLQFYIAQTKWPTGAPTPALPYDDLALFYQVHAGRPPTPLPPQLPPASIENVDAFLTEDDVVTDVCGPSDPRTHVVMSRHRA